MASEKEIDTYAITLQYNPNNQLEEIANAQANMRYVKSADEKTATCSLDCTLDYLAGVMAGLKSDLPINLIITKNGRHYYKTMIMKTMREEMNCLFFKS
jgi:hypothetical protein